jgi:hypothetical protein
VTITLVNKSAPVYRSRPISAAKVDGTYTPLLRAAASPHPSTGQLQRRKCGCTHLPNKREYAYDSMARCV